MEICHTSEQSYSDDVEFCPRDGAALMKDGIARAVKGLKENLDSR